MIVAISSTGPELTDRVDPRFGRARYFIIYNTVSNQFSVLDNNENLSAVQGAGIVTAQNVVKQNVQEVITGNVGPKAFAILNAAGIKTCLWSDGTVAEAIDMQNSNKIKSVDQPNVHGHWS